MKSMVLKLFMVIALIFGVTRFASAALDVTGAGASFPAPLYAKWATLFHKETGNRVNYQSVGSGAGLRQIEAKTVDFGASDAPLTDAELSEKSLIQFPMAIGGIVPVVNIKGIASNALKLDGQVLGDIYLGKIVRWNDAAISALNPALKLPDLPIAVVRRADASGTSFGFTHYLSQIHQEWKEKIGFSTQVNWPTGLGGKGNEGVAAFVSRLEGAIGYVEFAYAKRNQLPTVLLKNRAGFFVEANEASFKAAAQNADWKKSFYQILTNQPGENAWAITSATFIMMNQKQDKPDNARAALAFFQWAYQKGDATATELDYIAMPNDVKKIVTQLWTTLKDKEGQPLK